MNTDACNVENINLPHITECSSLSSIASFAHCVCLFRTWSFTLHKNDLDPNDNSDSVSSSSMTNWCASLRANNGSLRSIVICFFFQNDVLAVTRETCLRPSLWAKKRVSLFYHPSIHQISTLEKTKFHQHSILSTLMSVRIQRVGALLPSKQRVSPFYRTAQLASSEDFDFRVWFSPGFLMQWKIVQHTRIPFAASRDQIHHRLRFWCDSFFTCIFLRSFRHHFKTIGRTEKANVKQTQKMIPFITCEISLGQYVCELVFGVSVFDLYFLGPNWLYRTTNQEQLCGFWKHVSLSGFFPL